MSENNDAPSPSRLVSIDLRVPGSSRHGRAFLSAELLRTLQIVDLEAQLGDRFVEDDDKARIALLEQALAAHDVTVQTYPGETSPVELHAYVQAPQVSGAPVFACVLASPAVLEHLTAMPPYVAMETAAFQVVSDPVTSASMVAGIEDWISRVWPGQAIPRILLSPWPGPLETKQTTIDIMRHCKGVPSLGDDAGARTAFSPPAGLVAQEFRLSEDAA